MKRGVTKLADVTSGNATMPLLEITTAKMSPSIDSRDNREFASEVKFLISPRLSEQVRQWARAHLQPDPYAGGEAGDRYQISSLYLDTPEFDVFHRRGSFGRSKYRVRRYGDSAVVFLERKLKTHGLVTKRRSIVRSNELRRLSEDEERSDWPGGWFQRRLQARGLSPVCQISYRRTARVAVTPFGPVRLTLDGNLTTSATDRLEFNGEGGESILRDRDILELKFRFAMPVMFKNLVEELALTPEPFSKYRYAASCFGLAGPLAGSHRTNREGEYA